MTTVSKRQESEQSASCPGEEEARTERNIMETPSTVRKRVGRPPKVAVMAQHFMSRHDIVTSPQSELDPLAMSPQQFESSCDNIIEIDGSAVAVSPMPDDDATTSTNSSVAGAAECRRSSRKKFIKFDVRDLLNKSRKPHKIQIEARIDSNAPTPSMAAVHVTAGTSASAASTQSTADLARKQKTFIEKSAIFRRYSTSEQQGKPVGTFPHLPASSILVKEIGPDDGDTVGPPIDAEKIALARRLSRTQEIFNATMMKSKQNTSLIIAQMESSSSTSTFPRTSRTPPGVQIKKSVAGGRRKKAAPTVPKAQNMQQKAVVTQKRRGRPPKNRSNELALSLNKPDEDVSSSNVFSSALKDVALLPRSAFDGCVRKQNVKPSGSKTVDGSDAMSLQADKICTKTNNESKKLTPDIASNWQEYKASLQPQTPAATSNNADGAKTTTISKSSQSTFTINHADFVLEISSSSSGTENKGMEVTHLDETRQRNFAAVSFLQEGTGTNDDNLAAPEFIVAAVEEIVADTETSDNSSNVESAASDCIVLAPTIPPIDVSLSPIYTKKFTPKTILSDSESETASSELSNKHCRVSLKRLSLSTALTKSLSERDPFDVATNCSQNYKIMAPKKRSKRLQKKSIEITGDSDELSAELPEYAENVIEEANDHLLKNITNERQQMIEEDKGALQSCSDEIEEERNAADDDEEVLIEEEQSVEEEKRVIVVAIQEMPKTESKREEKVVHEIFLATSQDIPESDGEKSVGSGKECPLVSSKKQSDSISENTGEKNREFFGNPTQDLLRNQEIRITKLEVDEIVATGSKTSKLDSEPQLEPSGLPSMKDENRTNSIGIVVSTGSAVEVQVQALSNITQETIKSPTKEIRTKEPIFKEHDYLKSEEAISYDYYQNYKSTETCTKVKPSIIDKVEDIEVPDSKVTRSLPPKKQVGKFHYFEPVVDAAAIEDSTPVAVDLNEAASAFSEPSIHNVSVETSTLLDILRTVQSNRESQFLVEDGAKKNSPMTDQASVCGSVDMCIRPIAASSVLSAKEETFDGMTGRSCKELFEETDCVDNEIKSIFPAFIGKSTTEDEESTQALSVSLSKAVTFTLDCPRQGNNKVILLKDDVQVENEVEIEATVLELNAASLMGVQTLRGSEIDEATIGETVGTETLVNTSSPQTLNDDNCDGLVKVIKHVVTTVTTSPVRRGRKPKQPALDVAPTPLIDEANQLVKAAAGVDGPQTDNTAKKGVSKNNKEISSTEPLEQQFVAKAKSQIEATLTQSSTQPLPHFMRTSPQHVVKVPTPMPLKKRMCNYQIEVEQVEQQAIEEPTETDISPEKIACSASNKEVSFNQESRPPLEERHITDKDIKSSTGRPNKSSKTHDEISAQADKMSQRKLKYANESDTVIQKSIATMTAMGKRGKPKPRTNSGFVAENVATNEPMTTGKKKLNCLQRAEKSSSKVTCKRIRNREEKREGIKNRLDKKQPTVANMDVSRTTPTPRKSCDDKSDKKKRQKKLIAAFEEATVEDLKRSKKALALEDIEHDPEPNIAAPKAVVTHTQLSDFPAVSTEPNKTHTLPLALIDLDTDHGDAVKTKAVAGRRSKGTGTIEAGSGLSDPLLDIEKFIEAGVNLLKRPYKHEDDETGEGGAVNSKVDSDPVMIIASADTEVAVPQKVECTSQKEPADTKIDDRNLCTVLGLVELAQNSQEQLHFSYETPADTPLATPTASPPPPLSESESETQTQTDSQTQRHILPHPSKSPENIAEILPDELCGVRRSHRIKQITKTPKALVGRGLVREKERLSLKDDIETKSHYSLDDHLTDLAEVEAKNAKFLKDMEERLSNFQVIKENDYKCERVISREARKMICDCFLTSEEEIRGELGCGEDCLNRLLMIECGPDCHVKERCTNKRFQKYLSAPCRVFRTEKKGFGIMADIEILAGEFIMEYVGEVIDGEQFEQRRNLYSSDKNRHYYFMALRSDAIIDATIKGNISRFINHSCDPNAETQKWTVNGELRIGFFSRKSIMPGEEITFDYQYQRYGREAQRCYCESANCRGWIGEEPNSDEGEQMDDEEDSDVDNLANCLLRDVDDDTDGSEIDPAEMQKKLELAAAAAQLTPYDAEDNKHEDGATTREGMTKTSDADTEVGDSDPDEDSNSKFKKLLSKLAEKVAKKRKQNEKKQRRKKRKWSPGAVSPVKSRYREDPNFENMVRFLSRCGLKTQSDTLLLSRLMVIAKDPETRLTLLGVLRDGELPCRRLFLDYHGLRLLHGWMSESGEDANIRMALLETLECLPIANKTVLTDSKVYQSVRNWCGTTPMSTALPASGSTTSPTDDSSKESGESSAAPPPAPSDETTLEPDIETATSDLQKLAAKLVTAWDSLPEIFRIPKRERIEQMKEHEREADLQYAAAVDDDDDGEETNKSLSSSDRYQRDRFGRASRFAKPYGSKEIRSIGVVGSGATPDLRKRSTLDSAGLMALDESTKHLSKEERRELFAAKVARDEAEKRLAEERREYETKCRFFGLDPKKTMPQEIPFCVDPTSGLWYNTTHELIPTPPTYAHVQALGKIQSTDPAHYQLPEVVAQLPPEWQYAITPQGKLYYYHVQQRIPQWEAPTEQQIKNIEIVVSASESETESEMEVEDSSEADEDEKEEKDEKGEKGEQDEKAEKDDNNIKTAEKDDNKEKDEKNEQQENDAELAGMDEEQLKALIEKKIELRRQRRYQRLVEERPISPRREEDRIYNQLEVRKYKENKEKIRKRKEEIRRRRAETLKTASISGAQLSGAGCLEGESTDNVGGVEDISKSCGSEESLSNVDHDAPSDALPIQDFLLSSDEEVEATTVECNSSPLLEKTVQGDKIVDELDALKTGRPMKRSLPSYREVKHEQHTITSSGSGSSKATVDAVIVASAATNSTERSEYKRRRLEKKEKLKKNKEVENKYRKLKEKFRCEIAGIIVHHLKPYRQQTCPAARIQSDDDFNHLARKLTHFVMIKELKYCESVGQTLVVTESVKNKSREFIKKYMSKYEDVYVKPGNDPEFKDIPFTL